MRRPMIVLGFLLTVLAAISSPDRDAIRPAFAGSSQILIARLGISAGDAIADAPLGTSDEDLRARLPLLWLTADQLEIAVITASVGRGFWSDDGLLETEHDLDLVVRGRRDAIEGLARVLGRAWDQSTVIVWYPTPVDGTVATATIPLPSGATLLTDEIFAAIAGEIGGGAHVTYAGAASLIFVAKSDDAESDAAFYQRMDRLVGILTARGIETGPIERGRADVVVLTRNEYEQGVMPRAVGAAVASGRGKIRTFFTLTVKRSRPVGADYAGKSEGTGLPR